MTQPANLRLQRSALRAAADAVRYPSRNPFINAVAEVDLIRYYGLWLG